MGQHTSSPEPETIRPPSARAPYDASARLLNDLPHLPSGPAAKTKRFYELQYDVTKYSKGFDLTEYANWLVPGRVMMGKKPHGMLLNAVVQPQGSRINQFVVMDIGLLSWLRRQIAQDPAGQEEGAEVYCIHINPEAPPPELIATSSCIDHLVQLLKAGKNLYLCCYTPERTSFVAILLLMALYGMDARTAEARAEEAYSLGRRPSTEAPLGPLPQRPDLEGLQRNGIWQEAMWRLYTEFVRDTDDRKEQDPDRDEITQQQPQRATSDRKAQRAGYVERRGRRVGGRAHEYHEHGLSDKEYLDHLRKENRALQDEHEELRAKLRRVEGLVTLLRDKAWA